MTIATRKIVTRIVEEVAHATLKKVNLSCMEKILRGKRGGIIAR